ncbi:hypothetical protein H0H93_016881 [Arthromyces matolae]|nr:hypothetical protein H0H93_016881 [Arthromyces matolae]
MREIVLGDRDLGKDMRIPKCKKPKCNGLVKPDIVFFGESLPTRFIQTVPQVGNADLLLIIGTSLTVHPFASLAGMADRKTCKRVLINLERVGDIGRRPGDVVLQGECDTIVRELCEALGWSEELEKAWAETALKGPEEEDKEEIGEEGEENKKGEDDTAEAEVDKIAEAIGKQLDLSEDDQGPSGVTDGKSETTKDSPSEKL